MTKKSIQSVINEKTLLSRISSPFIVNMHYAFQDREVLYLVMDLMTGGDLRYHIGSRVRFTEVQASTPSALTENFSSRALSSVWSTCTSRTSYTVTSNPKT